MNRIFNKNLPFVFLFICVIFLSAVRVDAQLDPTFGTNGVATANTGVSDVPLASYVLADGKILVVSRNDCCGTPNKIFFIRFNADGTLDTTYDTDGIIEVAVPFGTTAGEINGAARQPDGKIILVGRDDIDTGIVARYNEDATLDTSFASGGVHRPEVAPFNGRETLWTTMIQPDGKILVTGEAETGSASDRLSLLRYNPNGTFDASFGTNGGYVVHNSIASSHHRSEFFSVQSSGKILVGANSGTTGRIRRFNADGSVDSSFPVLTFSGTNTFGILPATVQPDDKILVGSGFTHVDPLVTHGDPLITRLNPDGSLDTSFGTGGQVSFDFTSYVGGNPVGFEVMADGQILVAVNSYLFPNRSVFRWQTLALARLSSSGTVNGRFLVTKSHDAYKAFMSVLPDGKILTVFRTNAQGSGILLIRATDIPLKTYSIHGIPYDFPVISNGNAKPSVYRPSDGKWYLYGTSAGGLSGLPGDIPVPTDYIGNYFPDYAFYRPSNGTWYIRNYSSSGSTPPIEIRWGLDGDIPVPADYNGDGKSDVALFRPSDGNWYIYYFVDGSYEIHHWGLNGDKPVPGDFDGDGKYDIAVFRPSDGNWYIYRSSDGGYTIIHFGLDGDIPVQEDYDGDGKFDIAVYRPTNGVWYRLNSSDESFFAVQWGLPGDIPAPGNYDFDLKTNIAVWRPSNGGWYILNPDNASMFDRYWGIPGDVILPAKY